MLELRGVPRKAHHERRQWDRASILLNASVVTLSAYQYFDLVNLSVNGAKLRGPSLPPAGKTAMFRLEGYRTLCKIIWSDRELCGVRFDEPMPRWAFEHYCETGRITGAEMLTLDEQQAEEEWRNGAE